MSDTVKLIQSRDMDRAIRQCAQVCYGEYGEEVLTARLVDVLRESERIYREKGNPSIGLRLRLKSEMTPQPDEPPWDTRYHQVVDVTPDHPKYESALFRLKRARRLAREQIEENQNPLLSKYRNL